LALLQFGLRLLAVQPGLHGGCTLLLHLLLALLARQDGGVISRSIVELRLLPLLPVARHRRGTELLAIVELLGGLAFASLAGLLCTAALIGCDLLVGSERAGLLAGNTLAALARLLGCATLVRQSLPAGECVVRLLAGQALLAAAWLLDGTALIGQGLRTRERGAIRLLARQALLALPHLPGAGLAW
jgi:hypothetical protein